MGNTNEKLRNKARKHTNNAYIEKKIHARSIQARAEDFQIGVALKIPRESRENFFSATPKFLSATPIFWL